MPGEKFAPFLGELQKIAFKVYLQESTEIREHLISNGFVGDIENSQMLLDLRKNLGELRIRILRGLQSSSQLKNFQLGSSNNGLVRRLQTS